MINYLKTGGAYLIAGELMILAVLTSVMVGLGWGLPAILICNVLFMVGLATWSRGFRQLNKAESK